MLRFECRWTGEPPPAGRSGFDLGHMSFAGSAGICTSQGRTPDQAMMLCVALVELLDGVRRFLTEGAKEYTFVGADSSFSVRFRRAKKERVAVHCGTTSLGEVDAMTLSAAILGGAQDFMTLADAEFPSDDPVREDMTSALQRFVRAIGR